MKQFKDFLKVILIQEGGSKFHEVKGDRGGATKYGISLLFLKDLPLVESDLNDDGIVNSEDIKLLTEDDATKLYRKYFWDRMNLDLINNDLLKLHLFSHGVNAGTITAVKILQRILRVELDGKLGRVTAIEANSYKDQPKLVQGYASARKVYYSEIVKRKPDLSKFLKGWYNRVDTTYFI